MNPLLHASNAEDVYNELLRLSTKDGDEVKKLLNEGNEQPLLQIIRTVSSMMEIPRKSFNRSKNWFIRNQVPTQIYLSICV